MRLFGEPDHTGAGLTFHTRFITFSRKWVDGRATWERSTSGVDYDLAYLVGSLPSYWMEMPLGKSPLRFIADIRRGNSARAG